MPEWSESWGRCQNCGMIGQCREKSMTVVGEDVNVITGEIKPERKLFVCHTCFDTPTGCVSENKAHKRLPDSEYVKDKA